MKVFKFEQSGRTAALAIVAAENGDQASKLMGNAYNSNITDIDGYSVRGIDFDAFDLTNPIEIPCLQTTLTEPTIIAIV